MKSKFFLFLFVSLSFLNAQDFWEKTNFPSDNSSLYSIYSLTTNSSDHILAGTFAKGIFKSTDQGLTWSESGLTNHWAISFAKDNAGNIFVASIGSQFGSGVYKSTDDGNTWNRVWDALTGMNCVYVDQNSYVYVGLNYTAQQGGIYRSTDGGSTWLQIFSQTENVYAVARLADGRILAAGYGKIFYTDNGGSSWTSASNGLVSSTPSAIAVKNQSEIFLTTLGYGIYKSTDGGVNWVNKTGAGPEYSCMIINQDGSMYAGTRGYWVYRSLNNGDNWELLNSGMGQEKYVLSLLTSSSGYLFAGLDYNGLYKSINAVVTDVAEENLIPDVFILHQNYPNPFNPTTTIEYGIQQPGYISLKIFDVLGGEVATLVDEVKEIGSYRVEWVAANFSSGIYFYKLQSGSYTAVKKLMLLK